METTKKYRYPGINFFETTDTDIFFGREDDQKKLADLVEIEKNVLLYSRSGLGKSSLLNAALIPELSIRGYQSFYIRLGLFQENSLPPVQNIIRKTVLAEQKQLPVSFLQKFINRTNSLWYVFKSLQIAQSPNDRPIVLIFDQFEEIGSYPTRQLTDFKQQVAELLSTPIPKYYLEALKDNDLLTEPLTDAELDLLYKPLRVKVIFSIRSDQLSVINELSDHLPNILKVFYELKALNSHQALQAIVKPAKKKGAYLTPVFDYRQEALDKILKALSSEKNNEIDTAQLQILLQYIEKDIVEKKGDTNITAEDLGDLNKVYENYYRNSLLKLKAEQEQAQVLIEDKLIVEGRRISYDKALCLQLVRQSTLDRLVETRLLRQEPNSMGGYSYEVSHDSLIAPIMEAREKRILEEARKKTESEALLAEEKRKVEYETQLAEQRKKQRQQRLILSIVSAALIVSLSLGIWAYSAQVEANRSRREVERSLNVVTAQKAETQKALNGFIQAEIARKKLERDQLQTEIETYKKSRDYNLANGAQSRANNLEKEINDLQKRLKK